MSIFYPRKYRWEAIQAIDWRQVMSGLTRQWDNGAISRRDYVKSRALIQRMIDKSQGGHHVSQKN